MRLTSGFLSLSDGAFDGLKNYGQRIRNGWSMKTILADILSRYFLNSAANLNLRHNKIHRSDLGNVNGQPIFILLCSPLCFAKGTQPVERLHFLLFVFQQGISVHIQRHLGRSVAEQLAERHDVHF